MAPEGYFALGYCKADYVKPGIDWVFLEDDEDGYDLFGDGVLRCWRTPGHSPGHHSFEVHLPSGAAFMLAMDAANTIDHLEERVVSGVHALGRRHAPLGPRLRRLAWRARRRGRRARPGSVADGQARTRLLRMIRRRLIGVKECWPRSVNEM